MTFLRAKQTVINASIWCSKCFDMEILDQEDLVLGGSQVSVQRFRIGALDGHAGVFRRQRFPRRRLPACSANGEPET